MNPIQMTRARKLQIRAYTLFGRSHVSPIAEATGYTREYVSRLLNDRVPATDALGKIAAFIEEEEAAAEALAEATAEAIAEAA